MGDYEKNSENMSHLIHKKKLLRDGSDLFDLDRTERRRGRDAIIITIINCNTVCMHNNNRFFHF